MKYLNNFKPSIDHLRVFGCVCYVFVPETQENKLELKSIKFMFIWYSSTQKGFKCYDPTTRRANVSRDVKFDEEKGLFDRKTWETLENLTTSKDSAATLRLYLMG